MKKLIIAALLAAAGLGIWRFMHREPPDISEDAAKAIAAEGLQKFCSRPSFNCADFSLQAQETPTDKRFHWAFRYENHKAEPGQRVFVSVGRKGDSSVEFTILALAKTAQDDAPDAAASPLSWSLCELPPSLP